MSEIQNKEDQNNEADNSAIHIPVVMVSFVIFKLRDLVLVKDCYKKDLTSNNKRVILL